jgi:PleD family two-component response regulator
MFLSALEDAREKARGFEAGGNDYDISIVASRWRPS